MRILYITTISATMGFFVDEFCHLQMKGHILELACNCDNPVGFDIDSQNMKVHNIPFSRSPISLSNIKAYKQLKKVVGETHYDIIHCHTPNAAAVTRLACRGLRKNGTRIIYTAHGFHFYKGAPIVNWLLFYPIEYICAHWTDVLITINLEDYWFAKKKMKAKKVEYIPGVGIDLSKFSDTNIDLKEKRAELCLPADAIVLLSVGELNNNKNHATVIRAISGMDVYYLIAGIGDNEKDLKTLAEEVNMQDRVRFLGFRRDVPELLAASDAFVFPSFREGLSVSLMETMASGKPAIVSRIRGNIDLIDESGGALFDPYSVEECRKAIETTIRGNKKKMGEYNKQKIRSFSDEVVIEKVDEIYEC